MQLRAWRSLFDARSCARQYATDMDDIHWKEQKTLHTAKTCQAKIDGVAYQADKVFDQIQKLGKDLEGLKIYNAQLKPQIDDQNTI